MSNPLQFYFDGNVAQTLTVGTYNSGLYSDATLKTLSGVIVLNYTTESVTTPPFWTGFGTLVSGNIAISFNFAALNQYASYSSIASGPAGLTVTVTNVPGTTVMSLRLR